MSLIVFNTLTIQSMSQKYNDNGERMTVHRRAYDNRWHLFLRHTEEKEINEPDKTVKYTPGGATIFHNQTTKLLSVRQYLSNNS